MDISPVLASLVLAPSAARTVSGDSIGGMGVGVDVMLAKEASFFLDVTAVAGTAPTLDVTIQTRDPVSGKWFVLETFPQITVVRREMRVRINTLGRGIAAFWVIAGTTPSFTFSVGAIVKS